MVHKSIKINMKVAIIEPMSLSNGYYLPSSLVCAKWDYQLKNNIPIAMEFGSRETLEIIAAARGYELVKADELFGDN